MLRSMKKIIVLFLTLLCCYCSEAQYGIPQNYVWAFGSRAGVDFSSGSPVAISTAISTSEGCASVSDASGSLLFYTDGYNVYNRTGAIMPSGAGIVVYSCASTSQGTLIIPVVGSSTQYYVFSLESLGGSGRLQYCIVDMTLDSGLGAVITSSRHTSLGSGFGEHMIAVSGNNCDIWMIAHKETSTNFYVYEVTASGIGSPVISTVGTFTATDGYSIGQFKISPDRTKLGCTCWDDGSYPLTVKAETQISRYDKPSC